MLNINIGRASKEIYSTICREIQNPLSRCRVSLSVLPKLPRPETTPVFISGVSHDFPPLRQNKDTIEGVETRPFLKLLSGPAFGTLSRIPKFSSSSLFGTPTSHLLQKLGISKNEMEGSPISWHADAHKLEALINFSAKVKRVWCDYFRRGKRRNSIKYSGRV